MSGVNETRFLVDQKSCEHKCGLNESVCNSKQKLNHDEFRCECKELDDWGSCKDIICGILLYVIASAARHVKLLKFRY